MMEQAKVEPRGSGVGSLAVPIMSSCSTGHQIDVELHWSPGTIPLHGAHMMSCRWERGPCKGAGDKGLGTWCKGASDKGLGT